MMFNLDTFLETHKVKLLSYLDDKAPESEKDPGPSDYIDEVLRQWSTLSPGNKLDEATREERTFWFALYLLEDLIEDPPLQERLDPYEAVLMKKLGQVTELLRSGKPLPDGDFATRPGEYSNESSGEEFPYDGA